MSLRYNDHSGAWGHELFTRIKFDWDALHHRTMPSPVFASTESHVSHLPSKTEANIHDLALANLLNTPRTARGSALENVLVTGNLPGREIFTGPVELFKHF
jgi:hypothetical protein